jgi:hypothetical protein
VNAVGRVSVGAPGTDIVGLGLDGGVVGGQAGSALAAALVAATVADLRTSFPGLSPQQLEERLIATADRPGSAVPDSALGWGVVNPVTALTAPLFGKLPAAGPLAGTAVLPASAAPSAPGGVTIRLPPVPADSSWAIVVAVILLVVAVAAVAIVAGVRRARARGWRPAGDRAISTPSHPAGNGQEAIGSAFGQQVSTAEGNSVAESGNNPGEISDRAVRRVSR